MDEPHDGDASDAGAGSPSDLKRPASKVSAPPDTTAQIPETEEQFRLLVESVRDYAIFLLDTEGKVQTWNMGAQRIKGYAAQEIIGQHFSVFYTPEDIARDHPKHELEIALAEGRFEEEGWRVRKDGTHFLANVVISAMIDSKGVHRGFSKVTRDVTERRMAQDAHMIQMRDQITRAFLREVLYSVTEGRLRFCESDKDLPAMLPIKSRSAAFDGRNLSNVRRIVRDACIAAGHNEDRTSDLLTGVGEATMNAAVHAHHARFQVCASDGGTVQVWITDSGAGIQLGHLHRATLERGYTTEDSLGHGFWLMLHTCDRTWLLTGPEGTVVVLEQDRNAPEPAWLAQLGTRRSSANEKKA